MGQECKNIAIIGGGASGCMCAYFLLKSGIKDITIFESSSLLGKLLLTGGGRCNLAHAEYDFKELAANYPRGEKFLYSIFSKFSTADTLKVFEELGVKTYTQEDGRIFPTSNSAADVRNKILSAISKANFVKEQVIQITPIESGFNVKTNKAEYLFSDVVISIGGGKSITGIKHNFIKPVSSLVGLNTEISSLSGISLKNVYSKDIDEYGDILFTHFGLSGPLIFKISSLKARDEFPYNLNFNLYPSGFDLQELLNQNSHKYVKNILSEYFPARLSEWLAGDYSETKACDINGKIRDMICDKIFNTKFKITGTNKGEETVHCGGYDLKEIEQRNTLICIFVEKSWILMAFAADIICRTHGQRHLLPHVV